jgi:flagellar basal body L-ring protein FlgH
MNNKLERNIILVLILLLIVIGLSGCGRNIQNCEFNPGVTVEQKKEPKDGEVQKESEIESKLPVKVSPKGEFNCSF